MNRATLFRLGLNIWPCIRGTGVWVTSLTKDFRKMEVRLPLSWRTRNRVGTIFGGSMYGAVDPFFMLMFMEVLGRDFVVWDKGANIRFKRPAKETLYSEFIISDELLKTVLDSIERNGEISFEMKVELKDAKGLVHAEIIKTLYAAKKSFYKEKISKRVQK